MLVKKIREHTDYSGSAKGRMDTFLQYCKERDYKGVLCGKAANFEVKLPNG